MMEYERLKEFELAIRDYSDIVNQASNGDENEAVFHRGMLQIRIPV